MATTRTTTKRRGRPPAKPSARKAASAAPEDDDLIGSGTSGLEDGLDLAVVYGGVSASWLAHVFGMDKNTVKKKLAKCTIVGWNKATPLYTIKEASGYLVAPKVDMLTYLKGLRYNDLPPMLQAAFWDGQLKRQKWEENAGELWRTADVLDVFSNLAKELKSTVQLLPERVNGLTDAQRMELTQRCDGLLDEIYNMLVTAPSRGATPSSLTEPETVAQEAEDDELV